MLTASSSDITPRDILSSRYLSASMIPCFKASSYALS